MPSTPQVVAQVVLFDYFLDDTGAAIKNARVSVLLNSTKPTTTISPLTVVALTQQYVTTDGNGYWQFSLIPNTNINPANSTYTVQTPDGSYDVTLGSVGPYQSTAFGTIVNVPVPLTAATSSIPSLLVAAGEPGIDTAAAGALLLGDNNATSIELGAPSSGIIFTTGGADVNMLAPKYRVIGTWDPVAGTGSADAAVQQAFADANTANVPARMPGGIYRLTTGLTIPANGFNIRSSPSTRLLAGAPNINLLSALNLSNFKIDDMFYDGGFQAGVGGLVLNGCLNGAVGRMFTDRFLGDTQFAAPLVFKADTSASQNCGQNTITAISLANGGRGIVFAGKVGGGSFLAPNNVIMYAQLQGRGGFASTLVDFVGWADNNVFFFLQANGVFAGSVDMILNSGVPGSANGIYEEVVLRGIFGGGFAAESIIINNAERAHSISARLGGTTTVTLNAGSLVNWLPGSRTAADAENSLIRSVQHARQTPAFNANPVPDFTLGETYEMAALTGAVAVQNPTNPIVGQRARMCWLQDGTGGRAVTYNGSAWRSVGITAQTTTLNTYTIDEVECFPGPIWRVNRLVTGQTL
jgi:hypothetical protein